MFVCWSTEYSIVSILIEAQSNLYRLLYQTCFIDFVSMQMTLHSQAIVIKGCQVFSCLNGNHLHSNEWESVIFTM